MSRIAVLGGDKQQEKFMILHDNFICTKECSKYNKFLQCLGPMDRYLPSLVHFPVNGVEEFFVVDCHFDTS